MRATSTAGRALDAATAGGARIRLRVHVEGIVQGVGFRPFVYGLAGDLGLGGYVCNTVDGVRIEIEGEPASTAAFLNTLRENPPPHARIERIEEARVPCEDARAFRIEHSDDSRSMATQVLPDIAVCPECLAEMRDPANRRYRYPFLNCTHCGPRYSILRHAPYDRVNTTMARFAMCPSCRREYDAPADRRFHAQPTACADCGPSLAWWEADGSEPARNDDALAMAADALRRGRVVALKGLGGFQLLCDAANDEAVMALRARKHRPSKPFAVMFPGLASVQAACFVSAAEARLLASAQAPIVLLRTRGEGTGLSAAIAPSGALTGAMLPYTPLHHLLMEAVAAPLVATSGNLSDEPICTDEDEAFNRLEGIADGYLVHNRPIERPVDDAVVRVIADAPVVLRSARGYAPLSLRVDSAMRPVLAVGAHQKNTVAIAHNGHIITSQHIGDLETTAAMAAFEAAVEDLCTLYGVEPACIVSDMHPDYRSTRFAATTGLPHLTVQHHYAHVLSCMAEHGLTGPVLGIAWDGTGYGTDGTIWGGEFLEATVHGFTRRAHLFPFRLPGGEQAVREPRRAALGLLYEAFDGDRGPLGASTTFRDTSAADLTVLWQLLDTGLHAPVTTSAGRLFDGVASLAGLCQEASFEGEAAMMLEALVDEEESGYPLPIIEQGEVLVLDWRPMVRAIVREAEEGVPAGIISGRFHAALAEGIAAAAARRGLRDAVLTGGCFQNARLVEATSGQLAARGMRVYRHALVPPNDGGIATGQAYFALNQKE